METDSYPYSGGSCHFHLVYNSVVAASKHQNLSLDRMLEVNCGCLQNSGVIKGWKSCNHGFITEASILKVVVLLLLLFT